VQIVSWFVLRWQLESTFQEVRTHLGVETQRQWSEWAILRTTPALLGLFSLVTLLAHQQAGEQPRVGAASGLVCQGAADLLGRFSLGAPRVVELLAFLHVLGQDR
jgi:hypothetical protein